MTTAITTRDPVQGLVDYVLDVKPFHTKILEVWVEYIYNDPLHAMISDRLDWEIYFDFEQQPGCRYGWDTTPWDWFWNIKDLSEIAVGDFSYVDGSATLKIDKFDAYRMFFTYLTALWEFRAGRSKDTIEPTQNDTSPQNPFRILWLPLESGTGQVVSECANYWASTVLSNQFWFDPQIKRLYRHSGGVWTEQPFYYTSVEPVDAQIGEYWFCVGVDKLYTRPLDRTTGWVEISQFYVSYDVPEAMPIYPEPWKSNWDYPPCPGASGEHLIYTRVTDLLSFEHGSEIFLYDGIRAAILDPSGSRVSVEEYMSRVAAQTPVRYRTTISQTSRNRYKFTREELPLNSQLPGDNSGNTTWTIDPNEFNYDGWDLLQARKDVKLGSFLTWKHTTGGTQLIYDDLLNTQTFEMVTRGDNLIIQGADDGHDNRDVACPWANGAVVYVRSTDDLPNYKDPTTEKDVSLRRYVPYQIFKITDTEFSLVILDRKTLAIDVTAMNGKSHLTFTASGNGRHYVGIGYPVPFMEVHEHLKDTIQSNKTREVLASSMEVFEGFTPAVIMDIAVGYTGTDNASYTGFVVAGDYGGYQHGTEIQVGGSPAKINNGIWTVDKVLTYTNTFPSFSSSGVPTPSIKPTWWDDAKLGPWPQPTRKRQSEIAAMVVAGTYVGYISEYSYTTFSLISVMDGIPSSTTKPHGFVANATYNFNEGSGTNAAHTTVADKLIFGSLVAIPQPDGTTIFKTEVGVPGVSIKLTDGIKAVVQEGLNRNDPYGGQTIGSYDSPFFDQDTYDENLDTVIQRLGSQ